MAEWYYGKNGRRHGPVDMATLQRMASSGELDPSDLLWHEGLTQWIKASQTKGLFPERAYAPSAAAAPPPQAPYTSAPPVGYGAPQSYYAGPPQAMGYQGYRTPGQSYKGMATTAMVLGICGVFCFGFITGVLAIIFAGVSLSGMGRTGNTDGKGMAIAGLVLGIIDVIGWVAYLALTA